MFSHKLTAQNLVPNPGFELMHSCSETFTTSSLENTNDWFNAVLPLTSVDWFSNCFCPVGNPYYCPPNTFAGFSYPHSGEAMAGFGPYSVITNVGESLGVRLSTTLTADSAYCFGFWIKNSQHDNTIYSLRKIDVAFVSDTTGINSKNDLLGYISVQNESDDGEWHYLSGYFIAQGGEGYLLIGSFDQSPDYYFHPATPFENKYVYYFFDDFSVTQCSKDSLLEVKCELPNVFTVNNDNINEIYRPQHRNISKLEIQVFNRWGNLVRSYDGLSEVWDGTDNSGAPLTEGVYFVKAVAESKFGDKLEKSQFVHLIRE